MVGSITTCVKCGMRNVVSLKASQYTCRHCGVILIWERKEKKWMTIEDWKAKEKQKLERMR